MGKSILDVLGAAPKGPPVDAGSAPPPSEDEGGGGSEEKYADLAFDALQDGDKDGFREAFIGAVKACVKSSEAGEYGEG